MSFLKNLFGPKDPVETVRKMHSQRDWSGLLSAARRLDRNDLSDEILTEIDALETEAGDQLARLNLEEGAWAQRNGELLKAKDHFSLAEEQARSAAVKAEIAKAQEELAKGRVVVEDEEQLSAARHAGCGSSCGTQPMTEFDASPEDLDEEARMEVLLASFEPELAERYLAAGVLFRKAWLSIQDGDDDQALQLLNKVPADEQDALFLTERGALLARMGKPAQGLKDLHAALASEPGIFHAFDTLVAIYHRAGEIDALKSLLKQSIEADRFPAYCWARLAEVHAQKGEPEAALAAGLEALEEGAGDPQTCVLCANLLEQQERFDDAEQLLMRLPAGGCGGGAHPILAEFWLRRKKNLDKALESFKGAFRQERDNPRWPLRIAQVYLAKGWTKDAANQLEPLLGLVDLPQELKAEMIATAEQLKK